MKKYHIVISALPALLMMSVIFMFSATKGQASGDASRGMADYLLGFFSFGQSELDVRLFLLDLLNLIIRKSGHILEFLILTLTYLHFLKQFQWKPAFWYTGAFGLCVLYAATDEIHQKFVPGRWSTASDVLIDSIGGILGVLIYVLFRNRRKRMEKKDAL